MRIPAGRIIPVLLATSLVLPAGCSGTSDRPAVYPVRGQLFVRGQPAVNAVVQLYAQGDPRLDGLCPHAIVGPDGAFKLTTYTTDDGAPAGTYALTVTWALPPKPGYEADGPDRFNRRYADPRRPVRQVTIALGENVLEPIDLK
jgi:hypothetical protein